MMKNQLVHSGFLTLTNKELPRLECTENRGFAEDGYIGPQAQI